MVDFDRDGRRLAAATKKHPRRVGRGGEGVGLISTHDLELVASFCDRVIIMYHGRIMEIVDADKLHQSTHPYTRGLLNCLPKIEGERQRLPILQRDDAWLDSGWTGGIDNVAG